MLHNTSVEKRARGPDPGGDENSSDLPKTGPDINSMDVDEPRMLTSKEFEAWELEFFHTHKEALRCPLHPDSNWKNYGVGGDANQFQVRLMQVGCAACKKKIRVKSALTASERPDLVEIYEKKTELQKRNFIKEKEKLQKKMAPKRSSLEAFGFTATKVNIRKEEEEVEPAPKILATMVSKRIVARKPEGEDDFVQTVTRTLENSPDLLAAENAELRATVLQLSKDISQLTSKLDAFMAGEAIWKDKVQELTAALDAKNEIGREKAGEIGGKSKMDAREDQRKFVEVVNTCFSGIDASTRKKRAEELKGLEKNPGGGIRGGISTGSDQKIVGTSKAQAAGAKTGENGTWTEVVKKHRPRNNAVTPKAAKTKNYLKNILRAGKPKSEPLEFSRLHIMLRDTREVKKFMKKGRLYDFLWDFTRALGIKKWVLDVSIIGSQIVEIYVRTDAVMRILDICEAEKVVVEEFFDLNAVPVFGRIKDIRRRMVRRLSFIYRRAALINLRKCILEGLPEDIQNAIKDEAAKSLEDIRNEKEMNANLGTQLPQTEAVRPDAGGMIQEVDLDIMMEEPKGSEI